MSSTRKIGLIGFGALLVLLFAGFAFTSGIGNPSVPEGDVALVEDVPDDAGSISQKDFDTSFAQAWKRAGLQSAPAEDDAQYDQIKEAAMNDLLDQAWLTGEAADLGVTASDREVDNQFKSIRNDQFPNEAAYQKFLEDSGFTNEQVIDRVRLQVLSTKIEEKIRDEVPPVSDDEVQETYEQSIEAYTTPESRDILLIVTSSKKSTAAVEKALAEDDSDKSFRKLAKEFSVNPSKNQGGKTVASEGSFPEPAGPAIMDAPEGEVQGPIAVENENYFFKVTKVNPEETQEVSEVEEQIKQQILPTKQQEALSAFVTDYNAKWRSRTFCAEDYLVARCQNFQGDGRNPAADPACFEEDAGDSDREQPLACPAIVTANAPKAPGIDAGAASSPFGGAAPTAPPQGPIPPGGKAAAPAGAPAGGAIPVG
jgi:parvulin-like peptidyl-prolyl isomerase